MVMRNCTTPLKSLQHFALFCQVNASTFWMYLVKDTAAAILIRLPLLHVIPTIDILRQFHLRL